MIKTEFGRKLMKYEMCSNSFWINRHHHSHHYVHFSVHAWLGSQLQYGRQQTINNNVVYPTKLCVQCSNWKTNYIYWQPVLAVTIHPLGGAVLTTNHL